MKNIFGFDVEMQNGEPVCYVTPSKIKNINQSPSSSRKIKRKGVGDRTSRLIFLESIRQVAERDTNMLTDAEYAIWLMIEFVKERESNQQPRPSEVTKAVYEDLLKRFSNESKVPVEDLRTLWKELPQKNTVKLHPQQLSVDKIINYNVQVNQASDVEELYNKRWQNNHEVFCHLPESFSLAGLDYLISGSAKKFLLISISSDSILIASFSLRK